MAKKRFSALSDALTEYVGNTAAAALVGAAMALITAGCWPSWPATCGAPPSVS